MRNTPIVLALAMLAGTPALADTTAPVAPVHHRHVIHRATHKAALAPLAAQPALPQQTVAENPAPIPNEWVTAPIDRGDQDTSVAPAVMQIHYPPMGDGYTLGSSAQAMDDREAAKVTGVLVRVPLGQ